MSDSILLGLAQNVSLLLVISLAFDMVLLRWRAGNHPLRQVALGLIIAATGIALMLTPWVLVPGIIFDTRSILLGIAGLFFGLVPTAIAMLITAAFRIYQGGTAMVMGVCVILATGTIGVIWRNVRRRSLVNISWGEIYLFGLVIHVVMLLCAFTLPWETAALVLGSITLPVLVIYPLGTALLGMLMQNRLRRELTTDQLRESEERLRLAVTASTIGFFDRNLQTGQVHFSPEWKKQIGYEVSEISDAGMEWESRVHPDDLQFVQDRVSGYIQGLRPDYEAEYRLRHKDGTYRWILARGVLQSTASGQAVRLLGCHIDITARKQNEEAILASERRFRGLAESSQDTIILYDRDCRRVYENPAALRASELSAADYPSEPNRQAASSEDRSAPCMDDILAVFASGSPSQRLFELESAAGTLFLDWRLSPVFDAGGKVDMVLGISRDITALKQADQALRRSEAQYRVLTESIKDVVWIFDTQTMHYRYISPSVEQLRGYTPEEILAVPIDHALIPADRDSMIALIQSRVEAFRSGKEAPDRSYTDEIEQPCKDGTNIWTESVTTYYENPESGHIEVRGVTRDIGARMQAIEERKKSETHYRTLFENMLNGFAYCQMLFQDNEPVDFIYIEVNKAFERLTGLKDVTGKRVSEVIPGVRESDPRLFEIYGRVALTGVPEGFELYVEALEDWYSISVYSPTREFFVAIFDVVTDRKRADEKRQAAQAELRQLLTEADQSRKVLLSLVEDQKQSEEKIRELNARLEQRVQERTLQLELANKELEAFAYSVSHDLRAPLRAMDGFSAALLKDYPGQLDEKGRHYLDRIQEASRRMGQLINDLLSLSRVTRTDFNPQQVNLSAIALEIADNLRAQEPQRRVDFDIDTDLLAQGDAHLLRIVLENLLSNAHKFTGQRDLARIQVGALDQDGTRVFFVRDNGVGFDMDYAGKLFAPFQRLHSMQEFPGTGIGLVTVQRIIHRHGGRVWVEAGLDQGAAFFFTLGGDK